MKNSITGETQFFHINDLNNIDKSVWVGVNSGKKLTGNYTKTHVCCVETRKEYSSSNWTQHIRAKDSKIKKMIYSCICDIQTQQHFDKAGWNRWKAKSESEKINHTISKCNCVLIEKIIN